MEKIIIVSNRLPVTVEKNGNKIVYKQSIGGLATGLNSVHKRENSIWVGWCGIANDNLTKDEIKTIEQDLLKKYKCIPVFLSKRELKLYYEGFSNKTIWPLFHYFPNYTEYDDELWECFINVNKLFFNKIKNYIEGQDIIWVHDYQLLLLPELIKKRFPKTSIGFFLHIPFPSYEIFRLLPWRNEILNGVLGADLIGFHTYDYIRHFISSVRRILGFEYNMGYVTYGKRIIKVDVFPMGIDYKRYNNATKLVEVKAQKDKIKKKIGDSKIILSVDRLDYSKGIPQRLKAFELFLRDHKEYREKVTLILIVAPSRTKVGKYLDLKKELDILVSQINSEHGTIGWVPVLYFFRPFNFNMLTAIYDLSSVLLVTPLRDGMNLVAKEYIATKKDKKGVLILSETTGAASELGEAIIVNPNNINEISDAIKDAIDMSDEQQVKRNTKLHERLLRYNVENWASDFMEKLEDVKDLQEKHLMKKMNDRVLQKIKKDYENSNNRLILLDYDGTLVSSAKRNEKSKPDSELMSLIKKITNDKKNELVIISGRNKDILNEWFKNINVNILAEHGVWIKEKGEMWKIIETMSNVWKKEIRPVLEVHKDRTPGSYIDEKEYSLTWHFEKCEPELASLRVGELKEALLNLTQNHNIGIYDGNKVIEIKNTNYSKGRGASFWLKDKIWDFILAVGDDWTDEDLFTVLPENSYSVKVGFEFSTSKYSVESAKDVRELLKAIIK